MMNRRNFHKILLGTTALSFAACSKIDNVSTPTNKKELLLLVVDLVGQLQLNI